MRLRYSQSGRGFLAHSVTNCHHVIFTGKALNERWCDGLWVFFKKISDTKGCGDVQELVTKLSYYLTIMG